jgi:hypothetical protein
MRFIASSRLALGLVVPFAFSAAPALASDDCCGCTCRSPGYWMNHPEAWPCGVTVGGTWYSTEAAVALMKAPTAGDKTLTMFRAVAAANLNLRAGCCASCGTLQAIRAANRWMCQHPAGSGVKARSCLRQNGGECLYWTLDAWNNGR